MSKELNNARDEISILSNKILGKTKLLEGERISLNFLFNLEHYDDRVSSRELLMKSKLFSPSYIPSTITDILNNVKVEDIENNNESDATITRKKSFVNQRKLPSNCNDEIIHKISMEAIVTGFFENKTLSNPYFADNSLDKVQHLFVTAFFSETKRCGIVSNIQDDIPLTQITEIDPGANGGSNTENIEGNFNSVRDKSLGKIISSDRLPVPTTGNHELNNCLNIVLSNNKKVLESTCFNFEFDSSRVIANATQHDNHDNDNFTKDDIHCKEDLHLDKVCEIIRDINALKQVITKSYTSSLDKCNECINVLNNESEVIKREICSNQELIHNIEEKIRTLNIPSTKPTPPQLVPPLELIPLPSQEPHESTYKKIITRKIKKRLFERLMQNIEQTGLEDVENLDIPPERVLTIVQKDILHETINKKNDVLKVTHLTNIETYKCDLERYHSQVKVYEKKEAERLKILNKTLSELRFYTFKSHHLFSLQSLNEQEVKRQRKEIYNKGSIWQALMKLDKSNEERLALQELEYSSGNEAVISLQQELSKTLEKLKQIMNIPLRACTLLEKVELERMKEKFINELKIEIVSLKDRLIREGKRRCLIQKEETDFLQFHLEQMREVILHAIERYHQLNIVELLGEKTLSGRRALFDYVEAKYNEGMEDIHSSISNLEGASAIEEIPWTSSALISASLEVIRLVDSHKEALKISELSQQRGMRCIVDNRHFSNLKLNANEWFPEAERNRLNDTVKELKYMLEKCTLALNSSILAQDIQMNAFVTNLRRLSYKISQSEIERSADLEFIQLSAQESFVKFRRKHIHDVHLFRNREECFKTRIEKLVKDQHEVKANTSEVTNGLQKDINHLDALVNAMRFEVSMYRAKLYASENDNSKNNLCNKRVEILREELYRERQKSGRLVVMSEVLKHRIQHCFKTLEEKENKFGLERDEHKSAMRAMRFKEWKQYMAVTRLGLDPYSLFLFFMQRVVNLAGSSKLNNDALRENGSCNILAAFLTCPKEEIKCLAVRALGSICWNMNIEKRFLGWDVIRHWQQWVDLVNKNEMEPEESNSDTFNINEVIPHENLINDESSNVLNQGKLLSNKPCLVTLLKASASNDSQMAGFAIFGLTAISFHKSSSEVLGTIHDFIETILQLYSCEGQQFKLQKQAAIILGNLGYQSELNQNLIGSLGGINAFVKFCESSDEPDVIESSLVALRNNMTLSAKNKKLFIDGGGIQMLMTLSTSPNLVNLTDQDQMDKVLAIVVECLVHCTAPEEGRDESFLMEQRFKEIKPIVLFCASKNLKLKQNAGLLLGNISRNDLMRRKISINGGIESLFHLCEEDDEQAQAYALWALSNLAWNNEIQKRALKYWEQFLNFCKMTSFQIQVHALCFLGNMLYFNEETRELIFSNVDLVELIISKCCQNDYLEMKHSALRALLSLTHSYNEAIFSMKKRITSFLFEHCKTNSPPIVISLSLSILLNIASMHHDFRNSVIEQGGIDVITNLQSSHTEINQLISALLDELSGTSRSSAQVSSDVNSSKELLGVDNFLKLCKCGDISMIKYALECLSDLVEQDSANIHALISKEGHKILLDLLLNNDTSDGIIIAVLWLLRNMTQKSLKCKEMFGNNIIETLFHIIVKSQAGNTEELNYRISCCSKIEASLSVLVALAIENEHNSREILKYLDVLVDIAENKLKVNSLGKRINSYDGNTEEFMKNNARLAYTLLEIIEPFNFYVCWNCNCEQKIGTTCQYCGHKILG